MGVIEEIANVAGVVNLSPQAGAAKSNYDPLAAFAARRPEDIHYTADINSLATAAWIWARNPDVLLQCGWSQILKRDVLSIPAKLSIGVHPSPLPVGRGAAVLNWRIIEGGGPWGNSLFVMEDKTDKGDILDFEPFVIEPRDDIRTANEKVNETTITMLRRTIPRIADGSIVRTPQDNSRVTRYYKRTPEDGRVSADWSAEKICRYVRALTKPFPGAFLNVAGEKLLIWKAEAGALCHRDNGTILEVDPNRGARIAVGGGESIWLTRVTSTVELVVGDSLTGRSVAAAAKIGV